MFNNNQIFGYQQQQTFPQQQYGFTQDPTMYTQEYQSSQAPKIPTYNELPNNLIPPEQVPNIASQVEQQFIQGRRAWQANCEAITYLRIINKQYPMHVNQLFEKFGLQILAFIDEVKPLIMRNTIYLITEVLKSARQVQLNDQIIKVFVPKIALKSQTTESKQIKEECLICMSEFVLNCSGDTALIVICDLSSDKVKNTSLQIFALRMFAKMLENLGYNFRVLKQETLQYIILTLSCLLESNRLDISNYAFQLCMFIYNLLGEQDFLKLIGAFLNMNQKDQLIKGLQQKNAKMHKKPDPKQSVRKQVQKNKENNIDSNFCPQLCTGQTPAKIEFWVDANQQPVNEEQRPVLNFFFNNPFMQQ